jgi:hypothetical protein
MFNRTIAEYMGAYVAEHQRDWDELVGVATYSCNIKPHASTGFNHFELVTSVLQFSLLPHTESSGASKEYKGPTERRVFGGRCREMWAGQRDPRFTTVEIQNRL